MTDENGNLSIDFLAGFTIFMVAFIWVVTMIPGLMIGLQSYTIDYDAVAYRTGVILVEDPGWPVSPPWESFDDMQKYNVTRFGLALSKDTPNILSQDKVNRFFCETAFIFPDDYRTRVIFGDYPYGFNISLIDLGGQTRSRGDPLPDGHGTIRRLVKIKGTSNATIGDTNYNNYTSSYIRADNVTTHVFSILIDNPKLLTSVTDPLYQIDSSREQIVINITDLKSTIKEFPPAITRNSSTIVLQNIKIYKRDGASFSNIPLPASEYPYIDGSSSRVPAMPYSVSDNVTLKFTPRFFDLMKAQSSQIYIALRFDVTPASTFLNNTQALPDYNNLDGALTFINNTNTRPFNYNYDPINVTQPSLHDAVVEVAVWAGSATGPIGGGGLPLPNGSFTIQASAGSGGIISPSGSVIVNNSGNQIFTIVPNTGYQIADLKVDNVSQGAISTYTFTNVVQDHAIKAYFGIPITAIGAISGTPQVGSVLTAGSLTPAGATATYQWQSANTSNGTYSNIAGATATTYTPVAGDGGYYIKVVATGTGSYAGAVTSSYVGPVTIIPTTQTFTANGTSTVPQGAISVDYCVVGGGGGGGRYGGGGGAGGFRTGTITGGLPVSYAVTVGNGGPGATIAAQGASGGISVFASITSAGGGGGGSSSGTLAIRRGADGGSGGGGIRATTNGGTGNTPPVVPSQGNNGGAGSTSTNYYGGGGGGAGVSGFAASGTAVGNGGAGSVCSINGVTYAGGGGGGGYRNFGGATGGTGGSGGGGNGGLGTTAGSNGGVNTGGGGGGGGSSGNGGNGGSGIVIVRYY